MTDTPSDNGKEPGNRILTAVFASSFYCLDWFIVAVTASITTFLKYQGLSNHQIWITLWSLSLAYSGAIVLLNDLSKIDFTYMETLRRLTNDATGKSRFIGFILEFIVFIRLLLWDGPDQLLIFFKERLPSRLLKGAFFVITSGFQMFIWAQLYILDLRASATCSRRYGEVFYVRCENNQRLQRHDSA